jgi:transposase
MNLLPHGHTVPQANCACKKDYAILLKRYKSVRKKYASMEYVHTKLAAIMSETKLLKDIQISIFCWMRKVAFDRVTFSKIKSYIANRASRGELAKLYQQRLSTSRRIRCKALANLFYLCGINPRLIGPFLFMGRKAIRRYIRAFKLKGAGPLFKSNRMKGKIVDDPHYKESLLSILHTPPADFGINRTTWTMKLLSKTMTARGLPVGHDTVSQIIRGAGYKFRQAREVLTSNDPKYRKKLMRITKILSHLGPRDRFFSIDEFGPFAVKQRAGKRLVPGNTYPTIPQWQRSKGFLIITAALELKTNQVTHFYSTKKNSQEMIKLLEIMIQKYSRCRRIYFSWDAASWHASKVFLRRVREVNKSSYRRLHTVPVVKLAPLPARAQFLNVIESVFAGMAIAIIHNSDYQSVDHAKQAIDRYFGDRNQHFIEHPKRAGNKIWGKELVRAGFREGQNCKYQRWCRASC